ncbi:beta-toxin CeII8-like [Centruroides sculpturatus]|uniref:beta-toxin CeII8-like n=1 Tax=Centruroides sculpturatus TaxID=218467 RepID=UPI000C6E3E90|nr:beta-toxin CeII8-like [Centruroides sculpturatus]
MNYFVLIFVAALLMLGVNCKKDAYPVDGSNCRYPCWRNAYCDELCKKRFAESGYCYTWSLWCWCIGLPDNTRTQVNAGCAPSGK